MALSTSSNVQLSINKSWLLNNVTRTFRFSLQRPRSINLSYKTNDSWSTAEAQLCKMKSGSGIPSPPRGATLSLPRAISWS